MDGTNKRELLEAFLNGKITINELRQTKKEAFRTGILEGVHKIDYEAKPTDLIKTFNGKNEEIITVEEYRKLPAEISFTVVICEP